MISRRYLKIAVICIAAASFLILTQIDESIGFKDGESSVSFSKNNTALFGEESTKSSTEHSQIGNYCRVEAINELDADEAKNRNSLLPNHNAINTIDRHSAQIREVKEYEDITSKMQEYLDEGNDYEAISEAQQLITHSNQFVRWAAAEALWWIGAPALPAMAAVIDSQDIELRYWITDQLFEEIELLDSEVHKAEILSLVSNSKEPKVRLLAVEHLSGISASLSFEPMSRMLDDSDPNVQELARINLSWIADEEFLSPQNALAWFEQNRDALDEVQHHESPVIAPDLLRGRSR